MKPRLLFPFGRPGSVTGQSDLEHRPETIQKDSAQKDCSSSSNSAQHGNVAEGSAVIAAPSDKGRTEMVKGNDQMQRMLCGRERAFMLFDTLKDAPEAIQDFDSGGSLPTTNVMDTQDFENDTDLDSEIEQELEDFVRDGVAREVRK